MKPKTCFGRQLFAGFVMVVGMWKMVYAAENKTMMVLNVGVVLDLSSSIGKMALSCIHMSLSDFYVSHPHHNTTIVLHIKDSKGDVLQAAAQASELIQKSEVETILGPESWLQARYVIQLGEKAEVPIISFNTPTTSTLSYLKSPYFFRLAHNHSSQIYAIRDIIKAFSWSQVIAIYQGDEFGKCIVVDLIEALQEQNVDIRVHCIDPAASNDQIREQLSRLSLMQTTVFVVHMVHNLASRVFAMAYEIGMMSEGYVWILSDATTNTLNYMNFSTLNSRQGVLGVKTYVPRTIELDNFIIRWRRKFRQDNNPDIDDPQLDVYGLWAYDVVWALAMAVERIGSDPKFNSGVSRNGKKIMESLSKTKFKGLGGEFSLVKGQLESPNLRIVNVIGDGESTVGYWTPEMGLTGEFNRKGNLRPIIWPGYSIKVPEGRTPLNARKKLRIGVPLNDFMPLQLKNGSISGYCTDIFEAAVAELPYSLSYEFIPFRGSTYDELITEVYKRNFDAAVGDITILANRTSFVDFTLPFTDPGISVIVPIRHDMVNHAWLFLKPLTLNLWITSFCFFVFIGIVVWILEHQNNEDFRRGPLYHQIGTSLWFSFSIMVFAQRETLMNNLTRFVVVIWFFVVFVLTQSYTASLTSWLTVQQLQPVTDINQIIKNNWRVGYQNGAFVYDTLKFLGIKNLVPYASIEELHELFTKGSRNGGIDAAIDEIPYMKLLLATYSDNYTMGDSPYNSGGFGFAFPIGSSLVDDMSKAVLHVTQSDKLNKIEEKWFGKKLSHQSGSSDSSEASSSSLDLSYFKSLFLITASAAIFVLTLYFFRFIHNRRFVEKNPCFWRRIVANFHIFIRKDDSCRDGQVVAEPPVVVAMTLEVADSPSTNALPNPSNDSVHSPEAFNGFADSSRQNQASLEIIYG